MKYFNSLVFLLITLISCHTTGKDAKQPNELIRKFKPFLNGIWITADYIDDVGKTKSPLKSSEKLNFISEFVIDTTKTSEDSIHVGAGMGNHEGGDFVLYFKQ